MSQTLPSQDPAAHTWPGWLKDLVVQAEAKMASAHGQAKDRKVREQIAEDEAKAKLDTRSRTLEEGHFPTDIAHSIRSMAYRLDHPVAQQLIALPWTDMSIRLIVLHGTNGTGKTYSACLCASCEPGSQFLLAHDVPDVLREKTHPVLTCRILVLDELGAEDSSQRVSTAVDRLISKRLNSGLRTVATTNLDAVQFKTRYGERLASRLASRNGKWIACTGRDARREPPKQNRMTW